MDKKFYIKQLEKELNSIFNEDLIDMTDYQNKKNYDKSNAFKSRALAAYSLLTLADIDPIQAANAVVDGISDNGIDAILFQKQKNILWLVQSKWNYKGQSPKANELRSFSSGVKDIFEFETTHDRFNQKIQNKEQDINSAINIGVTIKIIVSHTGDNLTSNCLTVIEDLIKDINNDLKEIAFFENFNLDKAWKAAYNRKNYEKINVEFELKNWGMISDPYEAYYGQINGSDVAKWWSKYKYKLFSKNIRNFIGDSEINEEIKKTLENQPEVFWYFNNGITVLCQKITRKNRRKTRDTANFCAEQISIVNGAQTIGCIGTLYENSSEEKKDEIEENCEILIRFISLEKCEEDFGEKVTRTTNTQNKIEYRDFIALDSEQERLYKELRTINKKYHYKRTAETFELNHENYELTEATVALACAHSNIQLMIMAKQDITKLWSNPSKHPYTTIFNNKVTAIDLYRKIDIKREIESIMKDIKTKKVLVKHGNLFILHLVYQKLPKNLCDIETSERDFNDYKNNKLSDLTNQIIQLLEDYLNKNYKPNQMWRVFTDIQKLKKIKSLILAELD
ncbi:MAG: hypothetical protein F6J94_08975 [Moorea sp. SIO1F2]|uniref:AIPR family protein n=1 Tax=Moorena sp. SIO1F2 TaxID=2607819 RepID=UPI0013BE7DC8|nr:AIPR family protein [Moorena sp. SIO1F2]NET82064.1 hypothetical protein [Moorena sp. SIO1F2]